MPWTHRSFWILPLIIAAVLALFATPFLHARIRSIYRRNLAETRRERLFLASFGFFTSVLVVRGITLAIHFDIGPFHDVSFSGRHIHHLVWGITLLLLLGYGWLVEVGTGAANSSRLMGQFMSLVFGVAAALTLDEFALWLNLRDVYWEGEGRESFEAMALFGALLCTGIFGKPFFHALLREMAGAWRKSRV